MDPQLKNILDYQHFVVYHSPINTVFGVCDGLPINPSQIPEKEKYSQKLDFSLSIDTPKLRERLATIARDTVRKWPIEFNLTGRVNSDNFYGYLLMSLFNEESKRDYMYIKISSPKLFHEPSKSVVLELENAWGTDRERSLENLSKTYNQGVLNQYRILTGDLDIAFKFKKK